MDPITLFALAMTAGSAFANNAAMKEAANAQSAATNAERLRQQIMERRQKGLSDESIESMEDFQGDQDQRALDLTEYYQAPTAADANADAGTVAPSGTSDVAVREMAKQSAEARGRTDQNAENLARLRSFGDLLGDKMTGIGRNSSLIDQLTGFRRGSNDAYAFEMDAASQQGAGKRMLGDIMGGLGTVAGGYGAMMGAGTPTVTNMIDRWVPGGDRLAAGLRGAGVRNVNSVRTGLLG